MRILVILLLITTSLNAQYNHWIFGGNNYIRFPGPVNMPNSSMITNEGCASISDATGLLFYTNGVTVWDRTHAVMLNGTGLLGDNSTTQSAVIVKQPGNPNLYYIFTVPESISPNAHVYSIVDMNANGGLGAIITKNILIAPSSTEKLVVCKHRNNIDYWIITHERNNNTFRAVLLSSGGIATFSTSNAGMIVTNVIGQMKISPNRDKLAVCNYGQNRFCLYNFDNSTGYVTNEIVLNTDTGPYGTEFSPDGSKLYLSFNNGANLYQFNLCNNNQRTTIATNLGFLTGQFQLSPDGRIFISQMNNINLHVINLPNNVGAACNFVLNSFTLNQNPKFGLPNNQSDCPIPILTNYNYTLNCGNFTGNSPLINCPYNPLLYEWYVNNSLVFTGSNFNTILSSNTTYTITLKVIFSCTEVQLTQTITTNANGNINFKSN